MTPVQLQANNTFVARCADVLALALSLWLACSLRGLSDADRYVLAGVLAVLLYLLAGGAPATRGHPSGITLAREIRSAITAWAWALIGLLVIGWITKLTGHYSRVAIGLWAGFGATSLVSWRLALQLAARSAPAARARIPVAIAGAGERALNLARFIESSPAFRLTLDGFFANGGEGNGKLPAPLLGDLDSLAAWAERRGACAVFIALSAGGERDTHRLVAALSDTPAAVYVAPSLSIEELSHAQWVSIGGLPFISVLETPFAGIGGWLKRAEDVALSLTILALATVPMLLIAAAVKLSSSGPALFRQRRYGINGSEIRVLKFRTMTLADAASPGQAAQCGTRLSPIGAFLRRTSLDELPQFFNVLRGDMSVVGPRPHMVAHNERYRKLIPGYMLRHRIKPGITGWAQIHGLRGAADTIGSMERRIRYDLWYIGHWSVWLDLWIVARSVPFLLGDRNAA